MEISVIICAYTENRWTEMVNAVESLQKQVLPPAEIILSIDHNDSLYDRACAYFPEEIRTIRNTGPRGLSGARNSGIAAAKGDIIAFLDDDATAAPDWLSLLGTYLDAEDVLGVGGSVQPAWPGEKAAWFPDEFLWVIGCTYKGLPEQTAVIRNPMGGCMCWRRDVFSTVGGFRDGIGRIGNIPLGCEETELCIRARQKWPERIFLYEPKSQIFHHIPSQRVNLKYFLSRCYAEGISKSYITHIVGKGDGLSSERTYTFRVLPAGVLKGLADGFHGDLPGFARAFCIVAGFSATVFGFAAGKLMLLRGAGNQFDLDVKPL
jgi:glucosyl-dolichyl phosphate glucuronosyltransferase